MNADPIVVAGGGYAGFWAAMAARRIADNLALQHSVWLASKLRMPLIVLNFSKVSI